MSRGSRASGVIPSSSAAPRRRARTAARGSPRAARACRAGRARSRRARPRGSPCSRERRCRRASRRRAASAGARGSRSATSSRFVAIRPPSPAATFFVAYSEKHVASESAADLAAAVRALERVRRVLDHRKAERESGSRSHGWPARCTGRIAFVRSVTSSRRAAGRCSGRSRARRRRPASRPCGR